MQCKICEGYEGSDENDISERSEEWEVSMACDLYRRNQDQHGSV